MTLSGIAGTITEGIVRTANPDESGKVKFTGLYPGNYNLSASGKTRKVVDILSGADQQEIFDNTDTESFSQFGRKHFDAEFNGSATASVALGANTKTTINVAPSLVSFSGTLLKSDMDSTGEA